MHDNCLTQRFQRHKQFSIAPSRQNVTNVTILPDLPIGGFEIAQYGSKLDQAD